MLLFEKILFTEVLIYIDKNYCRTRVDSWLWSECINVQIYIRLRTLKIVYYIYIVHFIVLKTIFNLES